MDHQIGTKLYRVLDIGCCKTVVDNQDQVVLFRKRSQIFQIQYIYSRIRWRFGIQDFCIRLNITFNRFRFGNAKIGRRDVPFREVSGKQRVCRTKDTAGRNNMISGVQQCGKGGIDRCHSGCKSISGFGSFHLADFLYKLGRIRIAETAVDIPVFFFGKGSPHVFGIFEDKT